MDTWNKCSPSIFFILKNIIHDEQGVCSQGKKKTPSNKKKLENCKDKNAVESLSQFELNRQPSIDWRERIPRRSQEPRDYSPLYKQGKSP